MAPQSAATGDHHIITQPHTLVTLWFVNAATPQDVLDAEPAPDRGFARKYLAQVNPAWPLTHIGDFDLTRSTTPSIDEFYIGGYPGLAIIQAIIPGIIRLSELSADYRKYVPAADVYATCTVPEDVATTEDSEQFAGLGGFAHWSGDTLKRAFSATHETIFEDIGLPEPFEGPFWEGIAHSTGIELPFIPHDMATAAEQYWLGFDTESATPALPITAFAVDGRPETKSHEPPLPHDDQSPAKEPTTDDVGSYDDYTPKADAIGTPKPAKALAKETLIAAGRLVARSGKQAWSGKYGVKNLAGRIGDEVRKKARNAGRR